MSKTRRVTIPLLSGLLLVVLLLSACGRASAPEPLARQNRSDTAYNVAFPRQQPLPGQTLAPDAAISGRLVLVDGCLRLDSGQGGPSWLPVWPAGFLLTGSGGALAIDDGSGLIIGQVGDLLRLRGGAIPDDPAAWRDTAQLRQPPPANCPGPYWLVGNNESKK